MTRGLLIVLEGIDGAGTTTQSQRLCAALEADGYSCHLTREPTTGPIGKLLRQILEGQHKPIDATTLSLLFAADRADHLQREIEPALAAGKVVVTDRYYHSSLAYQGTEEDRAWISQLNQRARMPDLVLFLRIDAAIAARRRHADPSRQEELFDALDLQERIAKGYEAVMRMRQSTENIEVVDGAAALEDVTRRICEAALELCRSTSRELWRR